jgi:uncharacterized protein
MNSVVHFELPADDLPRAKKFYKDVFDWTVEDVPEMDYVIVRTTEVDEQRMPKKAGAINGGMMKKDGQISAPSITIAVQSIDDHLKKITEAGGTIVKGKTPVGNMGFIAYFKDPEGSVIGIWETVT